MIAARAIPQPQQPKPPPRGHARARDAARRRGRRTRLRGYVMPVRIVAAFVVLLVPVMLYLLLMGNLTALDFSLARVTAQKAALADETARLGDRIAQLESRERLAQVAAKLHMHDPQQYAVVDVPRPAPAAPPSGIAFLGALFHH